MGLLDEVKSMFKLVYSEAKGSCWSSLGKLEESTEAEWP